MKTRTLRRPVLLLAATMLGAACSAAAAVFPADFERGTVNLIVAWSAERKLVGMLAQPAG